MAHRSLRETFLYHKAFQRFTELLKRFTHISKQHSRIYYHKYSKVNIRRQDKSEVLLVFLQKELSLLFLICICPYSTCFNPKCSKSLRTQQISIYFYIFAAAAAKSLQSCPTLCNPKDCSPPGSSIHGIFQARVLEWVAIASSLTEHTHRFSGRTQ